MKKILSLLILFASIFSVISCGKSDGKKAEDDGIYFEDEIDDDSPSYVSVTYECEGGGYINGEEFQLITKGSSTSEVVAVADEGWMFVEWSDGYDMPARYEENVSANVVYVAVFEKATD